MQKIILILVGLLVLSGGAWWLVSQNDISEDVNGNPDTNQVACTMDARQCPDGSYVERTGPNCQFVCPPLPEIIADIQLHIAEKANLITLATPVPLLIIQNPLTLNGQARGTWYFEASFPVMLTNWDGLVIAEGFATADGEWMTGEFVPFYSSLEFENPYHEGDPDFMKNGTLILQKENPSGLPENDDALEIPVRFAP